MLRELDITEMNAVSGGAAGDGTKGHSGDAKYHSLDDDIQWMSEEYVQGVINEAQSWSDANIAPLTQQELAQIQAETAEYYQEFGSNTMALGTLIAARSGPLGGAVSAYGAFWYGLGKLME